MLFTQHALPNTSPSLSVCEDGTGADVILFCLVSLQEFPDKQELHRNMLGLLGNVAEVRALRPQLLTSEFVKVFT